MNSFNPDLLKQLYTPSVDSHKGMNGKLIIIGGSHLFHSASLWSLQVASRIVDMVFYSSVPENNKIVEELKKEFRNGIIVRRDDIESYIEESDAVLIGPGMLRTEGFESRSKNLPTGKAGQESWTLEQINSLENEGEQSYWLTKYLLEKYKDKKWVIDAGALQMMDPEWLKQAQGNAVLTPHPIEFERVFGIKATEESVSEMAKKHNCIILVKGEKDLVCSPEEAVEISGGNAGMTKGGTGDVLAGLVAALATQNDLYLSATCGAYINKKAGDSLFEKAGYYFNASDLADEIPRVMKQLILP